MFRNYLTVAFRNLNKHRLYAGLNLFGLAIGLAACLLILLFVGNELSYDRWNPNAERIYRPTMELNFAGTAQHFAVTSSIVGPDCGRELAEVQSWCRMRAYGSYLVRRDMEGQQQTREEHVLSVDSTFFELFPVKILAGDARTALQSPQTMALSRSRAERYFGSAAMAIGQTLVLDQEQRYVVRAVFEDLPTNTHFKAHVLLTLNGNEEIKNDVSAWGATNNFHTYLMLYPGSDPAAFKQHFTTLSRQNISHTIQNLLGASIEDFEKNGQFARMSLQKMADIHLHSDLSVELGPNGSIQYVWIFSAIATFILLIACINFMNLATARAATRAREVGMRKALGGSRSSLISQFLSESVVLTFIAVALALGMASLAMPWFRDLTGQELSIPWHTPLFWLILSGGALLVGVLAGSYPAFFLSAFKTVRVLKGQVTGAQRGGGLRSALVIFQFAVSVALILCTTLIYRQLNYIQQKKLGFERSQLLIVDDAYGLGDRLGQFKTEMLQHPLIEGATVSGFLPVPSSRTEQGFSKARSFDMENMLSLQRWIVDADYIPTLGMTMAAGRNFDPARRTDSTGVIINESAAALIGDPNPIGRHLYVIDQLKPGASPQAEDFRELTIIGVVKDFHWASLRDHIGPLCLEFGRSSGLVTFRFNGAHAAEAITALEQKWSSMATGLPFSYRFLDDAFDTMYRSERRIGQIAGIFTGLALLVSCLGLFGLAAYTIEQRRKEIGIRKVLGASVGGVTGLLAKDFLKLVLIGVLIASPAAWYLMQRWLADFAYRIEVPWWLFVAAGLGAVAVAFLTVSFQSIKAALANPVHALRSE